MESLPPLMFSYGNAWQGPGSSHRGIEDNKAYVWTGVLCCMDLWDEAARPLTERLDLLRWAVNIRTPGLSSCMKNGTIY